MWVNHDTNGSKRSYDGFDPVPFSLANYPQLSCEAVLLYSVIANSCGIYKGEWNRCGLLNEQLMTRTHIKSQKKLNKTFLELEKYGIIKRKNTKSNRSIELLRDFRDVQPEESDYIRSKKQFGKIPNHASDMINYDFDID